MKKIFLLPLIILGLCANATNYYVSPNGNNSNSGTSSSPWLTIAYAASHTTSGDVINVGAGTYSESSQIVVPLGVNITGPISGSPAIIASTYACRTGNNPNDGVMVLSSGSLTTTPQTISYLTF